MKLPSQPGLFGWMLLTVLSLGLSSFPSRAVDVSFYTVQKAQKYNQTSAGAPTLGGGNPYRFEATVATNVSGALQTATVAAAGGTPQTLTFNSVTEWYDFTAKFSTQALLDAGAPSGNYTFVINTVHD